MYNKVELCFIIVYFYKYFFIQAQVR